MTNAGKESGFSIKYHFFEKDHVTEIAMLVNDDNILSFERKGKQLTTRWNLDDLTCWLRNFLDRMKDDPYPVDVAGAYAAIKDINAREFDSEDENEFDAYYNKLDEWNYKHRWHTASAGGIMADLYFQLVGNYVEISWNNQDPEKGVAFKYILGGIRIPKEVFVSEVNSFLEAYRNYWS